MIENSVHIPGLQYSHDIRRLITSNLLNNQVAFNPSAFHSNDFDEYNLKVEQLKTSYNKVYNSLKILSLGDSDELSSKIESCFNNLLELSTSLSEYLDYVGSDIYSIINKSNRMLGPSKLKSHDTLSLVPFTKKMYNLEGIYLSHVNKFFELIQKNEKYYTQNKNEVSQQDISDKYIELRAKTKINEADMFVKDFMESSLYMQTIFLAFSGYIDGSLPLPNINLLSDIYDIAVRKLEVYTSKNDELIDFLQILIFLSEVNLLPFVQNIYIDKFPVANLIWIDVKNDISKKQLFTIYQMEDTLLENVKHYPSIKVFREPELIPSPLQEVPKEFLYGVGK